MKQLGIYVALDEPLAHCRWVLAEAGRPGLEGTGVPDAEVCRAARVRVTVAAASVLLVATRLPPGARRQSDEILTYAVEDRLLGDPDAQQASWLGRVAGDDVLAVMDKAALAALTGALARAGIENPVIECETLMLPLATGEWSVCWDGCSGYVRTTTLEGAVLDEGRANCPPLTLRLLVQSALARGIAPATLALYCAPAVALPELALWQRELGLPLRAAGVWDWRQAPTQAAIPLVRGARLWAGLPPRLVCIRWHSLPIGRGCAPKSRLCTAKWRRVSALLFQRPLLWWIRFCRCGANSPRPGALPAWLIALISYPCSNNSLLR